MMCSVDILIVRLLASQRQLATSPTSPVSVNMRTAPRTEDTPHLSSLVHSCPQLSSALSWTSDDREAAATLPTVMALVKLSQEISPASCLSGVDIVKC